MKKILLILSIYFAAVTLDACRCPKVDYPYFDFSSLDYSYINGTTIPDNSSFEFYINDGDLSYVASNQGFSLASSAYATQKCEETEGFLGRKYSITSWSYTSDSDFDALHPAGTSLNDLVYGSVYNPSTFGRDFKLLSTLTGNDLNEINHFKINAHPSVDLSHKFTVTIVKSNGISISEESELIYWN